MYFYLFILLGNVFLTKKVKCNEIDDLSHEHDPRTNSFSQ